jgi:hypothetical protein
VARTREHVIETESRRIVASLLPADRFLERDQTERDYGVDLVVECFDAGEPSGLYLLLQVKGTDDPAPEAADKTIPFDITVKRLARAERFLTPCLLVWCPVNVKPRRFWYVWIQEYVRVILDIDHATWRQQNTVRVHIPTVSVIDETSDVHLSRLRHIANHPRRVDQFGQLARLTHEAPFLWHDPAKLKLLFEEALRLDAIYGDPTWPWSRLQRSVVEKGLLACDVALGGIDPTDEQLRDVGWVLSTGSQVPKGPPSVNELTIEQRWNMLAHAAQHCAQLLSNAVAVYFDYRLRNTVWKAAAEHEF